MNLNLAPAVYFLFLSESPVKSKKAKVDETEIKSENEDSEDITEKLPSPVKTPKTDSKKSKKEQKPKAEKAKKETKATTPKAEKAKKETKATTPKVEKAKKESKATTPKAEKVKKETKATTPKVEKSKEEPKSTEKTPKSVEKTPKTAEKSPKTMGNCCDSESEGKTPGKESIDSRSLLAAVIVDEKDYSEVVKRARYDPIDDAMWKKGVKTPYLAFAKTLQSIEATSGRLKTIEILANYFRFENF